MRPCNFIETLSSMVPLSDQTNRMLPSASTVVTGGLSNTELTVVLSDWISVVGVVICKPFAVGVRIAKTGRSSPASDVLIT
ncbi:hypothetical protein HYN69_00420 [Gemmobacter aquarius]|uniref:Uncharacterized protein n=1 Tax=Paragemmobacter aquarius TaxID=2169400 RepID=A0A2S0UH88_9RHOB|nr:hypothetical protein HYN69_00420 [Gemmobacter aquarius]